MQLSQVIYITVYFFIIYYFVVLGCFLIASRPDDTSGTSGEMMAKERMTHSVGIYMFIWAAQCFVYLPSILLCGYEETQKSYDFCFLLCVLLNTPTVFVVMHSIVEKRVNTLRWVAATALPFLILMVWYATSFQQCGRLPIHIASALVVACNIFLLLRYAKEYNGYIRRLRTGYSDTTGREIFWAWSCFAGFALQSLLFIVYQYYWTPVLEYLYMALSVLNATYLYHCTKRQRPLSSTVAEAESADSEPAASSTDDKAFYGIIEQKLRTLCEEKKMYLEPDLTRETLCLRLAIGRTYLGLYFRSRGTSFYQYINTLRVNHAVSLMRDNPKMPVGEVCELSGFRSQTTFRKVFQEVMGCLPSEIKL